MDKPTKFLLHTKIPNDFASSRSLKENVHNSCLVHIFFMDKLGGFLIYSKTGYDMRLCLNFDPRSLYKFKDTDRKKVIIHVWSTCVLGINIVSSHLTQRLLKT